MSLWWHMLNMGRSLDQAHELAMEAMRQRKWHCGVCKGEMAVGEWHSCKSVTTKQQRPAARERRRKDK